MIAERTHCATTRSPRGVCSGPLLGILCLLAWSALPGQASTAATQQAQTGLPKEVLAFREHLFTLEIAHTPEQREKGLMFRSEVPFDGGMLFVFPDDKIRQFWMCNTLVPLDIAFLDAQGQVTALHTMQPEPPRIVHESEEVYQDRLPLYSSKTPCRYVIEFTAGTFGALQLRVGDRIPLDTERLQGLVRNKAD